MAYSRIMGARNGKWGPCPPRAGVRRWIGRPQRVWTAPRGLRAFGWACLPLLLVAWASPPHLEIAVGHDGAPAWECSASEAAGRAHDADRCLRCVAAQQARAGDSWLGATQLLPPAGEARLLAPRSGRAPGSLQLADCGPRAPPRLTLG